MRHLLAACLRAYKFFISPLFGVACRFAPTCSDYAHEAVMTHGALKGSWLAARRICRCHPFGGSGFDPVPSCTHTRNENP